MSEILLAKSEPQVTLKQHTQDGLSVLEGLKISFPLTPKVSGQDNFWHLLRVAIITHDLGKAHEEFQKILRTKENNWNRQRHELFSLSFTNQLPLEGKEKLFVLRVVAAHHRSYGMLREFIEYNYDDDSEFLREFAKLDIKGAKAIANELEKDLLTTEVKVFHPGKLIKNYKKLVRKVTGDETADRSDFFTQLLLMGAFHQCDHLSSGFVTEFPNLTTKNFLFLAEMKKELKKKGFDFYSHQSKAASLTGHTILTAPTGSGKTETSMLWLKNQFETIGQGRVFYILPFTASINAMFERLNDNKEGLGKNYVGMLHGKSNAYLYEKLFEEAGDLRELKDKIKATKEQFKNLQTPLKVLTPFQLLKHIFGVKGFEKGIFEWVGGHFIFDEIHAYSPSITAQIIVLLEFLHQKLDAKVFIMTATLPTFLKKLIKNSLGQRFSEIRAEDSLYNSFQRHKLKLTGGLLKDNYKLIEEALTSDNENGEKQSVLIVCNTVDAAREVFGYFKNDFESLLLHGRFAAKDRNKIEKNLREKPPQLLVGTQAIEVSLDIDYDIIFTEPTPLDALIQRFGRVNRRRKKKPCPCIVFRERNEKDQHVYAEDLIKKTIEVLEKIERENGGVIQEIELQNHIDEVYPDFSEKAQEEYQDTYNILTGHLKNLFPFEYVKVREEEFYKQFDGVKVVPACSEKEYLTLLEQFDFIGADLLTVSLRSSRFRMMLSRKEIEPLKKIISNPHREEAKLIEIDYYKINKKYEPDTGLDFEINYVNVSAQMDSNL